jgi:hypothetical protein
MPATVIVAWLGDNQMACALNGAGRGRVGEIHCIATVVPQVEAVYEKLLQK